MEIIFKNNCNCIEYYKEIKLLIFEYLNINDFIGKIKLN